MAGQPIGTVDDVTLTDDAQAEVTISVDETLHEGTTAVIRATSLSGIANRYVSIAPGPTTPRSSRTGATLTGDKTTSPVDLDQLFNTFRPRTRLGAAERHPGLRRDLRRPHRGAQQHLQVLRARAVDGPAPVRRADQRQPGAQPVPGPGLAGARSDRRAPQRPLGADRERQPVPGRDREREQRARPLAGGLPAGASPGEHHLRQPACVPRRPDPGGQRLQARDQGPGPVPAQAAPGRRAVGPRLPRPAAGDQPPRADQRPDRLAARAAAGRAQGEQARSRRRSPGSTPPSR